MSGGSFKGSVASKRPQTEDQWEKPLHTKVLNKTTWFGVDALIAEAYADNNRELLLYEWLKACCLNPSNVANIPLPSFIEEAELEAGDIEHLKKYGYIHIFEGTRSNVRSTVKVFCVLENDGSRRRVLFHPALVNGILIEAGFEDGTISLPRTEEQVQVIQETPGAMCCDGTAFYTQFPGCEDGVKSDEFVFEFEGVLYQPSSICTGQRQCVALAQIILRALAILTKRAKNPAPTTTLNTPCAGPVFTTEYIDNIRFAGEAGVCEDAWRFFRGRAESAGLTFEVVTAWSPVYTFLGILYNHNEKTVRLGPKAQKKLALRLHEIETGVFQQWLMQDIVSVFGILIWGSTVLALCPAPYYWVYKFLRRRSSLTLTTTADVWPSITTLLKQWIRAVSSGTNFVSRNCNINQTVYVFSDASLDGYGVVVYAGNKIYITAGAFNRLEHINILEARAWMHAITFVLLVLGEKAITTHIQFRIDNTSVIFAQDNGRSSNFFLNVIISRLQPMLRACFASFGVDYVKSCNNHADIFSRLGYAFSATLSNDVDEETESMIKSLTDLICQQGAPSMEVDAVSRRSLP